MNSIYKRTLTTIGLLICTLLMATPSMGQATRSQVYGGTLTRQTQTFYMQSDVGLQTYESEAVASNATTSASTFRIGGYAGESRRVGISFTSAASDTAFQLNNTEVRSEWKDFDLQLRLGFINPFLVVSDSEMVIAGDELEDLHIFSQGVGAGATIQAPLTDYIIATASTKHVVSTKAHDRFGHEVKMGARSEVDFNAAIDVSEHVVDYYVGYKARTYSLTVDGVEATENQSMPYTGVRMGFYF